VRKVIIHKNSKHGLFHGWFSAGNNDEGLDCYGLIEFEGGICEMVLPDKFKFIWPPKSEAWGSPNSAKEQQPCGEHNNERGVICSDIICTYCISGAGGGHACHVDCKDYNCFEGRKLNE